jgi:predicted acyl esterase
VGARRPLLSGALAALAAAVLAFVALPGLSLGGVQITSDGTSTCTQDVTGSNYDGFPGEGENPYYCYFTYATTSDGTQISVAVSYPSQYSESNPPVGLPALFMMDGYDGGGGALDPNSYGNEFVMVHASIRGTGCSSGQFDLFSWQDAEDGAYIVNNWIPSQPWSNGRVGIIGHSYPGLTGFMTAERIGYDEETSGADSNHLDAIAVSGLIDDLYRGIVYMGGVPDYGFPLLWAGVDQPESELQGNAGRYYGETSSGDTDCLTNIAEAEESDAVAPDAATDNPIVNGLTQQQDSPYWSSHSLITYAAYVNAPIHMDQQFQDEQTGPRGGTMLMQALQNLEPSLPKRIVYSNGRHDSAGHVYHADEEAWLDCYLGQDQMGGCEDIGTSSAAAATSFTAAQPQGTSLSTTPDLNAILTPGSPGVAGQDLPCPGASVVTYFGTVPATTDANNDIESNGTNPPLCSSAFPLPGTLWDSYYLNADGTMSPASAVQGAQGSRSYLSTGIGPDDYVGPTEETPVDQTTTAAYGAVGPVLSSQGPDELTWALPFSNTTTIDGPIMADFWASVAGVDTDFFVQLIDLDKATGAEQFLQYGLLRASYASGLNLDLSDCVNGACGNPGAGQMYRPYYDYTNPQLLTPGQLEQYRIEVFPLGWEFQPGHTLLVTISAPPGIDQLYAWAGAELPATANTIVSTAQNPSTLLLPVLPSADNPVITTVSGTCAQYTEGSGAVENGEQEGVRCTTPAETATSSGLP